MFAIINPLVPTTEIEDEDLAFDLIKKASGLACQLPFVIRKSLGDLIRPMNSYYSNFIEGYYTSPHDIDRALYFSHDEYDAQKKAFKRFAVAQTQIKWKIDDGSDLPSDPTDIHYLNWLYNEIFKHYPPKHFEVLLRPDERQRAIPSWILGKGYLRNNYMILLENFEKVFRTSKRHSRIERIMILGAAHQRLLRIKPFTYGNLMVASLMSHACIQQCGLDGSLWSVARGLAWNASEYKSLFMDASRYETDTNIAEMSLLKFCRFFLKICIKEIDFMASLLKPEALLHRMSEHVREEVLAKKLHKGSFKILRESFLTGEVQRSRVGEITGYSERMARDIVSDLLNKGYLKSDEKPSSPLVLAFPLKIVNHWFPRLYFDYLELPI